MTLWMKARKIMVEMVNVSVNPDAIYRTTSEVYMAVTGASCAGLCRVLVETRYFLQCKQWLVCRKVFKNDADAFDHFF